MYPIKHTRGGPVSPRLLYRGGFTLIEAIIYIALFSIIMTSGFVIAFQLIQGSGNLSAKKVVGEETSFLLRKINWALSGATITSPSALSPYTTSLIAVKDGQTYEISFNVSSSSVEIREGSGSFVPLTTENVKVTSLSFHFLAGVGGAPDGIVATTTISGIVSTTTKYIRK